MPKINKVFYLEVTPEQFLYACSAIELKEIQLLLQSHRYRSKIHGPTIDDYYDSFPQKNQKIEGREDA